MGPVAPVGSTKLNTACPKALVLTEALADTPPVAVADAELISFIGFPDVSSSYALP